MKSIKVLIFGVLAMASLVSCNRNEIFFKYHTIPVSGWHKDSLVVFDCPVSDTVTPYNVYIQIRHHGSYPYQNLWLFIETQAPDSVVKKDTIEFYLADQYGKWLGNGAGALKEMPVFYQQNIHFPDSGTYQIRIRQGMRDSVLQGINNVGVRVEKAD